MTLPILKKKKILIKLKANDHRVHTITYCILHNIRILVYLMSNSDRSFFQPTQGSKYDYVTILWYYISIISSMSRRSRVKRCSSKKHYILLVSEILKILEFRSTTIINYGKAFHT